MKCKCADEYHVVLGRQDRESYDRAKKILNKGKHPTFIGRMTCEQCAKNGGLLIFEYAGEDIAVALLNTRINSLLVLNVIPEHRSHGIGTAVINYCKPTWIRALDSAKGYFEKLGYISIGKPKQGRTLKTQIMVRGDLLKLSGRMAKVLKAGNECA